MEELTSGFVKSSNAFSASFSFLLSDSAASSFSKLQIQETFIMTEQGPQNLYARLNFKLKTDEQVLACLPNGDQLVQFLDIHSFLQ